MNTQDLIALLEEIRQHFTRDDDLPDNLLPRIDAALSATQPKADERGSAEPMPRELSDEEVKHILRTTPGPDGYREGLVRAGFKWGLETAATAPARAGSEPEVTLCGVKYVSACPVCHGNKLSATQPKADERGSANKWQDAVEAAYIRAGHETLPSNPYRAVDELLELQVAAIRADERGSAEPGELPPACRSIGGCALATARAGSEPGLREARNAADEALAFAYAGNTAAAEECMRKMYRALAATPEQPTQAQPAEAVGSFAIEVEKLLCQKLGKQWQPTGMSIATLVDELAAAPKPAVQGLEKIQAALDTYARACRDAYLPSSPGALNNLLAFWRAIDKIMKENPK